MPYVKQGPFVSLNPPAINAGHLNAIETQYDNAITDVNAAFARAVGAGIDQTGATDSTAALNAFLAALPSGSNAILPPGTYLTTGITLPPNVSLTAYGAKLQRSSGASNVLTIGSGCRVLGLEIDGNKSVTGGASNVYGNAATDVILRDLYLHDATAKGISLVGCSEYQITGCRIINCTGQGVEVDTSNRGRITNNRIDTCQHGIQWWGGDSSTTGTLGIFDVVISGNIIKNVTGGIWGSLGSRITVTGNTVENCGDVGIDFEGCQNCAATGNAVTNATNAGLSVFYASSHIVFSGNTISNDASHGPAFKAFSTTRGGNTYVNLIGNDLSTAGAQAIVTDAGTLSYASIENNTILITGLFVAVRLLESGSNTVMGNRITTSYFTGISIEGGSDNKIESNRIEFSGTDSSAAGTGGGIYVYWRSSGMPAQRNRVRNNDIIGFVTSIKEDNWGDFASRCLFYENTADTLWHRGVVGSTYLGYFAENRAPGSPKTLTTEWQVPAITTQPSSQSVTNPATATFTVVASATPAATYQWQRQANGTGSYVPISGATSASYTTPATSVATNNGDKYQCVVTNAAAAVTSNAATLTVS